MPQSDATYACEAPDEAIPDVRTGPHRTLDVLIHEATAVLGLPVTMHGVRERAASSLPPPDGWSRLSGGVGARAGAPNNPDDVARIQARFRELGMQWLPVTGECDGETRRCIRLFQAMVWGTTLYPSIDPNRLRVDGTIDAGRVSEWWLWAANAPRWQILAEGSVEEGYVNERVGVMPGITSANRIQRGVCSWSVAALAAAGRTFRERATEYCTETGKDAALLPCLALVVAAASPERGGESPPHRTHQAGMELDLQLFSADGASTRCQVTDADYSRPLTRLAISSLLDTGAVARILFNDDAIIQEFGGKVRSWAGHEGHIHAKIMAAEPGNRVRI